MNNYSIYTDTERKKYAIIAAIRASGAILTGVSGCGSGYYLQLDAAPDQVDRINAAIDKIEGVPA